jgi:hypothetical protein
LTGNGLYDCRVCEGQDNQTYTKNSLDWPRPIVDYVR